MGDGFFGKLKVLMGIEEVDDEDEEEEEVVKKPAESRNSYAPSNKIESREVTGKDRDVRTAIPPQTGKIPPGTTQFKMVVIEPKGFEECPKLVDSLKAKKPIIINLEKIDSDIARKMFDFLSGATYALNGNVQKVANNIFIFAPANVDVSANMDHKSIDFNPGPKSPWK